LGGDQVWSGDDDAHGVQDPGGWARPAARMRITDGSATTPAASSEDEEPNGADEDTGGPGC
jgi:hypothetical protein